MLLDSVRVRSLPRKNTVFFFPVGPLEDHGPHLGLAADVNEAKLLCLKAAERLEKELPDWVGVIMPAVPLGVETNTNSVAIRVRGHVLRDWLVDACRSLMREGFQNFVCFTGHLGPKQLTAIEEAGKAISGGSPFAISFMKLFGRFRPGHVPGATLVSACSGMVGMKEFKQNPIWCDPLEHGGARDTSVALHAQALGLSPVVGALYAELPEIERAPGAFERFNRYLRGQLRDYWGAPKLASSEQGNAILVGSVDQVFPKLRAVWEGANPNTLFRSWYAVLPIHKSMFRAWLASFGIFLILLFWTYLYVRSVLP